MTSMILHHYPQSLGSYKVGTALGIASGSWQSSENPRFPPEPLSGNHAALIWKKELTGPNLPLEWGENSPIGHAVLTGISNATINIAKVSRNREFYRSGVICKAVDPKGKHAIDRDVDYCGCHY